MATEHSIDHLALGSYVGAVAASYVAYWHMGRLGLLSVGLAERSDPEFVGQERTRNDRLNEIANWAAMLAAANVAALRPVLDIQHIEVFLMTEIWRNAGRVAEVKDFFEALVQRLRQWSESVAN